MTRQEHIKQLRRAIARGEKEIEAMYQSCNRDIGEIVAMEEYSREFQELKRKQRERLDILGRLMKKEWKGQK